MNTENVDSKYVQNTSERVPQFSHTTNNFLSAITFIVAKYSVKFSYTFVVMDYKIRARFKQTTFGTTPL